MNYECDLIIIEYNEVETINLLKTKLNLLTIRTLNSEFR